MLLVSTEIDRAGAVVLLVTVPVRPLAFVNVKLVKALAHEPPPFRKVVELAVPVADREERGIKDHEVLVPLVKRNLPLLPVCEGRRLLSALLAVVALVPPFAIGRESVTSLTSLMLLAIKPDPFPLIGPLSVVVTYRVPEPVIAEPVLNPEGIEIPTLVTVPGVIHVKPVAFLEGTCPFEAAL